MVYRDATFLAKKLKVSDNELQLIQIAAVFHDYGFLQSNINHEEKGCLVARRMLPEYGFSPEDIESITGMIMATHLPQSPKNLLEEIIADADLFYLGSNYYFEIADTFKIELSGLGILSSDAQWKALQIGFLEKHKYFLKWSKKNLEPIKKENLMILKGRG